MDPSEQARRLAAVRTRMAERGLAAFLVPRADEHQLAYLPACAERLAWLTGFTGSAGTAVVGKARAALFVDGRYTIQGEREAPAWEQCHSGRTPPEAWLATWLRKGDVVGFDPRLHTPDGIAAIADALARVGATLAPAPNPIDDAWTDRPAPPSAPAFLYPEALAGESAAQKLDKVRTALRTDRVDAAVVSAPDCLAWLFNVRGDDVPNTPLVRGFAIVRADDATIFLDPAKVPPEVRAGIPARFAPPDAFGPALDALGGLRVRLDRATANVWIRDRLQEAGATIDLGADPCTLPKACKNATELAGMRAAHVRDGVALVRFMRWFAETAPGGLDEWGVAKKVDAFRAEQAHYRGSSFRTISACGPNAALAHYSVHPDSARVVTDDTIFLVDSGVQYLDGTTDVTRTFIVGTPTDEMRRRYTQVLEGHLALARARFPAGTTGTQLDAFARMFLWQDGVDYDHGTGHGVGCYLGVHEGPQGIGKAPNRAGLQPGMVLSDEPGYYKPGAFGIRIENLVVVTALHPQPPGAEHTSCGFETLTLAPYERRLIDTSLLTEGERAWVDAYHARVRDTLTPLLGAEDAAFLAAATAPLDPTG